MNTESQSASTTRPNRSGGFWLRLISLTRKEFRQLWRDASNLMIGIGLPIALILIFGYALTFDVRDARVAVVLEDSSPVAQSLVSSLELSDYFVPVKVTSMHEATEMMKAHESDAILRIPSDFARRLSVGDAQVQTLLLGSDPTRASAIRSYLEGAVAIWGQSRPRATTALLRWALWSSSIACGLTPPTTAPGIWCPGLLHLS